ncbi:MAG: SRPBCC domain-containing protein [Saprospiraceae bacterium]|nr:SRPBCC domain-containing protein [Saprospiraceae bacterium]
MAHDWTSFSLSIGVKASLDDVYNAWTKSSEVEKWFLEKCKYKDTTNTILEGYQNVSTGYTYEWKWFLYDSQEEGRILQANDIDFFQFSFAGDCLVDVELKTIGEYILVTLTQHNKPTDEKSIFNIRIGCLEGWTFYLSNLKSYLETGFDLRNKIPQLKGLNN